MILPKKIVKFKIRFLNFLDFLFQKEEFEKGKLTRLKQGSMKSKEWMKNDWELRAKKNPLYFIRSVRKQSEEEFWKSGSEDRDSILEREQIKTKLGQNLKDLKVLEIGCGIGRILRPMSEKVREAIGVDISQEMVNIGKQETKDHPNCIILLNNGIDLSDLSSNYFDFCYSFIVFQHIPEKQIVKKYIKEVARVLKPDSIFHFQIRGKHKIDPIKLRLLDKIYDKNPDCPEDTWLGVQFSSQEMHEIAEEFGFEIIEEVGENTEYYWLTFCLKKN